MPATLRGVALTLAAFLLVAAFGTVLPAEFPELRIAGQLLYGIPLAAWGLRRLGRRRTPLDLPILLALAAFVGVALLSRDVQGSLEMLGGALAAALLFWVMVDIRSPTSRAAIATGVLAAVTLWLAAFGVVWALEKVSWVSNGGGMPNLVESKQTLFWLTTNATPVLTLLGIGFSGYLAPGFASRVLMGLFWVASAVTVPMSGGRAGWLGLAVGGVVLLALARPALPAALKRRGTVAAGAVGVAIAAALVVAVSDRLLDASGLAARVPLWSEALSILAADPVTGGGPGTYSWLRLEHVQAFHSPVGAVLAHNVVLQTLADGGVLLLAGLLAVIAALGVAAWRQRAAMGPPERRILAILIGFGAVCLLDDHSSLPAIIAMVVTLAAWLVAPPEGAAPPRSSPAGWRHRAALLTAVAVLGAVALPAVWGVDVARSEARAGRAALLGGDTESAIQAFGRAADAYPARPNYQMSAGLALALDGQIPEARARYLRASELAPADARAWGGLAALADTDAERREFRALAAAAPSADPRYQFALGRALEAAGDPGAPLAYARAVVRSPGLLMALEPGALADAVVEQLVARLETLSSEARTDPESVTGALALAGLADGEGLSPAWRVIDALRDGDLGSAEQALADAKEAARFASPTWASAIALAERRCDAEGAHSASVLADLVPGGGVPPRADGLYRSPDLPYREGGLAGYQPEGLPFDAGLLVWPDAFLTEPEGCGR